MKYTNILCYVDHTQLKPFSTWDDIKQLCDESIRYNTASVCIPPNYVKKVKESYGEKLNICTVVGFPLGYNSTDVKVFEAKKAIEDGANEIDIVINIAEVKNNNFDFIEDEIVKVKKAIGNKILKVIIEACYLTKEEKIKCCNIITKAGADYIKTSTGFGKSGATIEDVKLFKNNIGKDVKIKAAGGIKTLKDLEIFLNEGCSRIGTSSAVSLLNEGVLKDY